MWICEQEEKFCSKKLNRGRFHKPITPVLRNIQFYTYFRYKKLNFQEIKFDGSKPMMNFTEICAIVKLSKCLRHRQDGFNQAFYSLVTSVEYRRFHALRATQNKFLWMATEFNFPYVNFPAYTLTTFTLCALFACHHQIHNNIFPC